MNKFTPVLAAVAALALIVPAVAAAHVTLQPKEVPAGSFTRLDVRVPNESDSAGTDRVEIEMPDGFEFVSYEPVVGWETKVTEKSITWTATDASAAIEPGQFRDFGLSVGIPEDLVAGDVLTFPAIQHYTDGETVRWIGEPESEHPAPQVTLTEAADEHAAAHPEEEAEAAPVADDSSDDDGDSSGLAIAALIVGALGLIVGGTALARNGRTA
jgi:uncharacterized protein